MSHWAHKAAALRDEGKIEEARRAFATAERWEAKVKAYEKKLDQALTRILTGWTGHRRARHSPPHAAVRGPEV
jgi:hypothetical protein